MATKTAQDVAVWMVSEIKRYGFLHHGHAAAFIAHEFGDAFSHANQRGGQRISEHVLTAFRKLKPKSVAWSANARQWLDTARDWRRPASP